jgi:hypothetical protein
LLLEAKEDGLRSIVFPGVEEIHRFVVPLFFGQGLPPWGCSLLALWRFVPGVSGKYIR